MSLRDSLDLDQTVYEFRWASEVGAHSMPYPDELRYFGYEPLMRGGVECRDPRYPRSLLMWRVARVGRA